MSLRARMQVFWGFVKTLVTYPVWWPHARVMGLTLLAAACHV